MIRKAINNGWFWLCALLSFLLINSYKTGGWHIPVFRNAPPQTALCAVPLNVPEGVNNLQESFRQVADVAKPAVVSISTIHVEQYQATPYEFFFGDPFEEFFGEPQRERPKRIPKQYQKKYEGMGSGVIIDPKGLVLTNEHVVRNADEIKIHLANGEKPLTGEVIGKDARTDLAVLRIREKGTYASLGLADSAKIKVGDWAIAIGSPFGLEQTLTVGVVSAVRQSLSIEGQEYRDLIQTDAAINRGNSGGPLLNIRGEVIGINTAIYAPTGVFAGIGFAIPINRAKGILDELISKGKVVRGWLGVEIKPVDEIIAKQFGLRSTQGALINDIFGNSPADKAGLKRGDVIVEFNGTKITGVNELQDAVSATPPKKRVPLKIVRNKKELSLFLVTGEMPSEPAEAKENQPADRETLSTEWLGMKTQGLDLGLAKKYRLPSKEQGVVIVEIDETREAAQAGLREGDLITSINQTPAPTVEVFNRLAKSVDASEGVIFDINREGRPMYISFMADK